MLNNAPSEFIDAIKARDLPEVRRQLSTFTHEHIYAMKWDEIYPLLQLPAIELPDAAITRVLIEHGANVHEEMPFDDEEEYPMCNLTTYATDRYLEELLSPTETCVHRGYKNVREFQSELRMCLTQLLKAGGSVTQCQADNDAIKSIAQRHNIDVSIDTTMRF